MKPSVLLLAASLAANIVLLAAVTLQPGPIPASAASSTTSPGAAKTKSAPSTALVVPRSAPRLWTALQTENLDDFRRRLISAGFPPKIIRTLLSQKIAERLEAGREALMGSREDIPYWKPGYTGTLTPDQQKQFQEIHQESRTLSYKYLSGPDALAEDEEARTLARRQFGDLSLEKLQQLTALQHDYEDLRVQMTQKMFSSISDPKAREAGHEAMNALEKENQAQLAKLLTPAELEQYQLRNNAGYLAQQLAAFKPTEDEFKAIYALQKSLGQAPADPNITPAQRQEEYEAKLAAALGPDRALDYLELSKAGSDRLPLLISRLDLPLSTIGSVNAVKSDITQRAQSIANDSSLTAGQRDTQLAALAQEANEKLTTTLGGKRGYDAYVDMKGDWLRSLQPKHK